MSVQAFMARADRALRTAKLVLDDGDGNAAASEAYYAMFNAARAALFRAGMDREASGKSHARIIAVFSEAFVQHGLIAPEHGRAFARAHKDRLVADYEGNPFELAVAAELISKAAAFIEAVRQQERTQT